MNSESEDQEKLNHRISRRIRACDYLVVAQLFLKSNFLLEHELSFDDIKPRLLGHWGTCHGINVAYANFRSYFSKSVNPTQNSRAKTKISEDFNPFTINNKSSNSKDQYEPDRRVVDLNFSFILGPGHGFPALQANLFLDGDLNKVDPKATLDESGIAYICRNFSWPGGFPSHASPFTPGVICEGGELGYSLGAAYGYALGHPKRTIVVMLGDGELETATALSSLNLIKLAGDHTANGRVFPILHLNGYKISAPTLYGRKSEHELAELVRGFGYKPFFIDGDNPEVFQHMLKESEKFEYPFFILRTEKGATGPTEVHGKKIAGNFLAHQIPLPNAKTDSSELKILQDWLSSYRFSELFEAKKGFRI